MNGSFLWECFIFIEFIFLLKITICFFRREDPKILMKTYHIVCHCGWGNIFVCGVIIFMLR